MASGSAIGSKLIELMQGYQQGSLEAFEELYDLLAPNLRVYLLSLTRDLDRASDLLQETFLQMHRSRHTYTPPRPVKPWAFGIARHVHLMERRRRVRVSAHETTAPEALPEFPVGSLAELVPERDDLGRALAEVPENRRESLLLHHLWGFSFKEVGALLGITERAAKLRAFRGIQQLRSVMGAEHQA